MQIVGFPMRRLIYILQGTRNSGKSLKGKNIANPVGVLLASCDMLDYLGYVRFELCHEKIRFLRTRKERRRSAVQ